eukprot:g12605.t1
MGPPLGACSVLASLVFVAVARTAGGLSDQHHQHAHSTLPLEGGSFLQVDRELPGPDLDDGTPTKLYSLSLGRVSHNHTASAELTAAVDAKKLARREWQGRRSLYMSFEDTPLFPGWGTHFAYVYAGTPAQRVSVIVDTGSHFTAFPCAGCKNCGSHTDPPWDYHKSTTSHIVTCDACHGSFRCQKDKRCGFSQRYSEGSSWSAFQVEDVLWVGELTLDDSRNINHDESAYSVQFMFGCIESQTGLFKTQLADGIMGMSADSHTLVWQLAKAGKIKERTFSLCFGVNGGTMVIGGYDPRLNKPGSEMAYTPSTKSSGWFTVKVDDMTLDGISISSDPSIYQRGKGIIVDSGTTDTYLPKSVAKGFSDAWEAATGSPYQTCKDNHFCMILSTPELEALPTLTIHLDGGVKVDVRPQGYMDSLGKDNAYAPRIYLTESMGGVLGANVMRDHNVVFDYENHVVGFAEGICDYRGDAEGNAAEGAVSAVEKEEDVDCLTAKKRMKKCDAKCPLGAAAPQTIKGHEIWEDVIITHPTGSGKQCPEEMEEETRECVKDCPTGASNPAGGADEEIKGPGVEMDVGVDPGDRTAEVYCSIEQELWTPCSADCLQERYLDEACDKEAEARSCHVGNSCSMSKAGLLLTVGLSLDIDVSDQGVAEEHSELWLPWVGTAIADAVAQLVSIPAGNVETTLTCVDPRAADMAAFGGGVGAKFPCDAKVEMHLTPKVDNVAADKVGQVINGTGASFAISLSSVLESAKRRHWLLAGVAVKVASSEKVSMFIASNGDPYLPPETNRLQSANPHSSSQGGPNGPHGATLMLMLAGMVVAVVAGLVFRVKNLKMSGEGEGGEGGRAGGGAGALAGYHRVPSAQRAGMEMEMPVVHSSSSASRGVPLRPLAASADGMTSGRSSVRRAVAVE